MDPFFRPEFLLLLLEQGDKSLEDHTRLFLMLANATCYPDGTLCSFYNASLNTTCRALSSEDGPRGDFAAYVEWTLARNGSPLTVCPEDDLARSTPDPEPSPPSPCGAKHQPEPTDDGEPFPAVICEPAQSRATERKIAPEVEPNPSDQVREPATVPTTREPAVDGVSAEWSSASCTAAEGELIVHLGLLDMGGDLIDWSTELEIELPPLLSPSSPLVPSSPPSSPLVPASSAPPERPPVPAPPKCPPVPAPRKLPPSHPLLPPPPLSSGSPSARPQPSINAVRAPRDCHPPASPGLEFPSPLPPASEAQTPPRSVDPVAPPRLLAPSPPPSTIDPPAPPGSLIPPAPPWSSVDPPSPLDSSPLAAPRRSVPPAPLGSFLLPAPPWSSVALALPWISGSPDLRLGRQSPRLHPGPPDPRHPPGSLAPWSRRPYLLHGSSLRRLHRGPSSWLWPGSCCAPPAPGPSCLFPGLCLPAPSRVSVLLLSRLQSSHPPLPFGCFCGARAHLPGGGRYVTCQDCFVFFAPHVFCDLVSPSCWLLIWFQVCLVISPLIVCVFKIQSIQFAFVGLWVSSLPVLPWCVTLFVIKDSSFVNSSSPRSWLPCLCVWNVTKTYTVKFLPLMHSLYGNWKHGQAHWYKNNESII